MHSMYNNSESSFDIAQSSSSSRTSSVSSSDYGRRKAGTATKRPSATTTVVPVNNPSVKDGEDDNPLYAHNEPASLQASPSRSAFGFVPYGNITDSSESVPLMQPMANEGVGQPNPRCVKFQDDGSNGSATAPQFDIVRPKRKKSALITNQKKAYKSVMDNYIPETMLPTPGTGAAVSAASQYTTQTPKKSKSYLLAAAQTPKAALTNDSVSSIPVQPAQQRTILDKLKGEKDANEDKKDNIRAFDFFIDPVEDGIHTSSDDEPTDLALSKETLSNSGTLGQSSGESVSQRANVPYGKSPDSAKLDGGAASNNSMELRDREVSALYNSLKRSFANQRISRSQMFDNFSQSEEPPAKKDDEFLANEEDQLEDFPLTQFYPVVSRENLDGDSLKYEAYYYTFKSDPCLRALLFGLRVTLFATFPCYVLTEHPNTKNFFVASTIVPVMAALFVCIRCTVGNQIFLLFLAIQASVMTGLTGALMNCFSTHFHTSGWWCGAIFACFSYSLLGDLASKRMMMMYTMIIMQMQHTSGGSAVTYPICFARDLLFGACFSLLAVILPFPAFEYTKAEEGLVTMHKLIAAGLANSMKGFFAPVPIDAQVALNQVPFVKLRACANNMKMLYKFCRYEPVQFDFSNELRNERVQILMKIRMQLHSMTAAAQRRIDEGNLYRVGVKQEVRELEKRLEKSCSELVQEMMAVLVALSTHVQPKKLLEEVSFDKMCDRAIMLSDIVSEERMKMLFVKTLSEKEVNSYLRTLLFARCLIEISEELQEIEKAAKNFDPKKYPSLARRAFNFFFYETWNDFWTELPKRLTVATPRDARLWKDGIKYTLGFSVACAFTLNYDHDSVYFFGMAILMRISQQTTSETLNIGTQRLCGLVVGVAFANICATKSHNLAEKTALTCCFSFIFVCCSVYVPYFQALQYAIVTSITTQRYFVTPDTLIIRLVDNVFAFVCYLCICVILFPVDPLRCLNNTRTKILINLNALTQTFVSLGCARITLDGAESQLLLGKARALAAETNGLLDVYGTWMEKCLNEPILRGTPYPRAEEALVLSCLTEFCGLHETILHTLSLLHRKRDQMPSVILTDMLELIHPFLIDVGKLHQKYVQELVNAIEKPRAWSMEEAVRVLWKAHLACDSLQHVTGNIQRNFFAAVQEVSGADKKLLNPYLHPNVVENAMMEGVDPAVLSNLKNTDMIKRLFTMSFFASNNYVIPRIDLRAFNGMLSIFEIELKTMDRILHPMLKIQEFEKSRVTT